MKRGTTARRLSLACPLRRIVRSLNDDGRGDDMVLLECGHEAKATGGGMWAKRCHKCHEGGR